MTRLTRTLALIVLFVSLLAGSARGVLAQQTGINGTAGVSVYKNKSNLETNVDKTLEAVANSVTDGTPSLNSLIDDTSTSWQTSLFLTVAGAPEDSTALQSMSEEQRRIISERYGRGVIGQLSDGIVAMYTPPASAQTYLADALHSAHIIPQAQAQGLGFASLDPILDVWKVFRNVAYLFFVVIFLVIGFMIMFRQKIGGQTVVTAQQAIPGVIVSLIFVTFSYAIAGFMIDLMYLLMYLLIGLFNAGGGTELLNANIFALAKQLLTGGPNGNSPFTAVSEAVQALANSIDTSLVSGALGWIGGITLGLVISIAVLIGVFKIFFELLKTYVVIILSIVAAPIILMIGAIPGKENLSGWIKSLVGNLLAFPVVLLALIFYNMFAAHGVGDTGGFVPPFLIGRGNSSVMIALVGVGVILVIPEIIKEVKKAFGADGGIFANLAQAAWSQVKEGWNRGGKQIVGGAAFLGATGASAGVGAGIGAYRSIKNKEDWRIGAKKGAIFGGAAPGLIKSGILKDTLGIVRQEVAEQATEDTWGRVLEGLAERKGEKNQFVDDVIARIYNRYGKRPDPLSDRSPGTRIKGGRG